LKGGPTRLQIITPSFILQVIALPLAGQDGDNQFKLVATDAKGLSTAVSFTLNSSPADPDVRYQVRGNHYANLEVLNRGVAIDGIIIPSPTRKTK